jgi:hypothetical protein
MLGECPMLQKYWWWANQVAPTKGGKNKLWVHPTLINRNMKISRRSGIWERV